MATLLSILAGLGGLLMSAGGIMILVAAFRTSVTWGVAVVLLPITSLVFVIKHWDEAKKGFLIQLVGTVLVLGAAGGQIRQAFLDARNHGNGTEEVAETGEEPSGESDEPAKGPGTPVAPATAATPVTAGTPAGPATGGVPAKPATATAVTTAATPAGAKAQATPAATAANRAAPTPTVPAVNVVPKPSVTSDKPGNRAGRKQTLSQAAQAAQAESERQLLLAQKQREFEAHAAQNKADYDALQARWAALKPGDAAAREKFDRDAAEYQARRKQIEAEKAALEALRAGR